MLFLYQCAMALLTPCLPFYLRIRAWRGKEDSARIGERMGLTETPRPRGRVFWLHAASVGEALAALTLAKAMLEQAGGASILLTTGTVTSAQMVLDRKAEFIPKGSGRIIHQFIPLDTRRNMRRFLAHWRPQLLVLAEGDLWPNMLLESAARGIPIALTSAQISRRTLGFWGGAGRKAAMRVFAGLRLVLAIDDHHASRFARLPVDPAIIKTAPSFKLTAPPPPPRPQLERALAHAADGRMIIALLSSHEGEEALFLSAFGRLEGARFLAVIAPRHPARGARIETMAAEDTGLAEDTGGGVRRAGAGGAPCREDALWIADTMGDMGGLIRAADIIVLGGGFARLGGHNPMEAAMLGKGVISGRHVFKNTAAFTLLERHGGVVFADDESALADHLALLAASPSRIKALHAGAQAAAGEVSGGAEAAARQLLGLIAERGAA